MLNGYNRKETIENTIIGTADKQVRDKKRRIRDKKLEKEIKFYLLQHVNKSEAMQILNDIRMEIVK